MTDNLAPRELRALLASIEEAGWDYARIEMDEVTLVVSSDPDTGTSPATDSGTGTGTGTSPGTGAAPGRDAEPVESTPAPETPAPVAPDDLDPDADLATVTSPSIGLFWRSPKPGAPPFVEVGQVVAADDTVCIVEVMKLMTHVQAGEAGTIARIHVQNGDMVEFGTPLADIARP